MIINYELNTIGMSRYGCEEFAFKLYRMPFSRSVIGANNDRYCGRYKNNTEYDKITPGTGLWNKEGHY